MESRMYAARLSAQRGLDLHRSRVAEGMIRRRDRGIVRSVLVMWRRVATCRRDRRLAVASTVGEWYRRRMMRCVRVWREVTDARVHVRSVMRRVSDGWRRECVGRAWRMWCVYTTRERECVAESSHRDRVVEGMVSSRRRGVMMRVMMGWRQAGPVSGMSCWC